MLDPDFCQSDNMVCTVKRGSAVGQLNFHYQLIKSSANNGIYKEVGGQLNFDCFDNYTNSDNFYSIDEIDLYNEVYKTNGLNIDQIAPNPTQRIFFNIPLKDIITHSNIENALKVYREDSEDKSFNAYLNLVTPFMQFEKGINTLLYKYFIDKLCDRERLLEQVMQPLYICECNGKITPGMPTLYLEMNFGSHYLYFDSSDYFIYPTITDRTKQFTAYFGLAFMFNDTEVHSSNRFLFGQLFVQKYQLRLQVPPSLSRSTS